MLSYINEDQKKDLQWI